MTLPLARSLLLAEVVTAEALAEALLVSAARGTSLVRALLMVHAIDPPQLERHLERGDAPYMRHVAPVLRLVEQLPSGLCERLLALPVRRDPRTGTIDVAVVDASDPHPAEEVAHWLRAPVRTVRTSLASLDAALRRTSGVGQGVHALAPPIWLPSASESPGAVDAAEYEGSEADADPDRAGDDPNIPFPLTRRSLAPAPMGGAPVIERDVRLDHQDPVVDLHRRKTSIPAVAGHSDQPVTERGPFGKSRHGSADALARPVADVASILDSIRETHDRDAIFELVLAGAHTVARRAAVLAVKRGVLVGWTCSPQLADYDALRTIHLGAGVTVLASALDHEGARIVSIPVDAAHAPLLSMVKTPLAAEVALVAVRVEGKAVALVLADDLTQPTVAARRLEEIARVAGAAIGQALRRRHR
jgi:hypothetical protein